MTNLTANLRAFFALPGIAWRALNRDVIEDRYAR
tara:strand:- start:6021 stop:6122 length:102 start_codon:yes stop_codon:yes gene_type:complete